jgi:predicted glutamine amidotransferase
MCRWLAYSGGAIPLEELIFNTPHSLIDQSLDSRLGPHTTNGDGFGVGWYDRRDTPGIYKSTQPAWNDANLHDLCSHIDSPLFMAHIRASTGTPVQYTNCHPFRYGNWLFVHNGSIAQFSRIRRHLLMELDEQHFLAMGGGTDSELMFMLALQFGLTDDPLGGVARMAGFVERIGRDEGVEFPLQMTLGIADGSRLCAVRYSSEGNSRSLYYSRDLSAIEAELAPQQRSLLDQMSSRARTVVSEPLSDLQDYWEPIPEASFIVIEEGEVHMEHFQPVTP